MIVLAATSAALVGRELQKAEGRVQYAQVAVDGIPIKGTQRPTQSMNYHICFKQQTSMHMHVKKSKYMYVCSIIMH